MNIFNNLKAKETYASENSMGIELTGRQQSPLENVAIIILGILISGIYTTLKIVQSKKVKLSVI